MREPGIFSRDGDKLLLVMGAHATSDNIKDFVRVAAVNSCPISGIGFNDGPAKAAYQADIHDGAVPTKAGRGWLRTRVAKSWAACNSSGGAG